MVQWDKGNSMIQNNIKIMNNKIALEISFFRKLSECEICILFNFQLDRNK